MTPRLYERQEIDENPDTNLALVTIFKTLTGKFYESKRRMTAHYPVTNGMGEWIKEYESVLKSGVRKRNGEADQHPLIGSKAVLTTLNGLVYFLTPSGSTVTFQDNGTRAHINTGRKLLPYFHDERDSLTVKLRLAKKSGEPIRGLMAILNESIWQLGEYNLVSSIRRYGLLPEVTYLGAGAVNHCDDIESGKRSMKQEAALLLAQNRILVKIQEPEIVSL